MNKFHAKIAKKHFKIFTSHPFLFQNVELFDDAAVAMRTLIESIPTTCSVYVFVATGFVRIAIFILPPYPHASRLTKPLNGIADVNVNESTSWRIIQISHYLIVKVAVH
jgi:hypothetical protein